jgi:hypothetical protein
LKKQRMITPLAKLIDWCVLHGARSNAPFHFAGTAVFKLSRPVADLCDLRRDFPF